MAVSLLAPEVVVVSLLVPKQTREAAFLGLPDPPELEGRGHARPRSVDGLVDDPADPGDLMPVANPGPGCGLLLLVPEEVTV